MFSELFRSIRSFISISVSEKDKIEYTTGINRINVARAKITALTFIIMELMVMIVSFIIKGNIFFKKPDMYYGIMYILLILLMTAYLLLFIKLEKNIPEYGAVIQVAGFSFSIIILFWCAGISLLDQLSNGQVIIYVIAILAIAITPIFKPLFLLSMYIIVQVSFLVLLPYFCKSAELPFGISVNTTTITIIAWAISCMRYKKQAEDFNNRKIIREKNEELSRINGELEKANRELAKLSQIDGLTGVFNRLTFDRTAKAEWDRCKRQFKPLSIIMIDIDFFKEYNDNYGHQAGDDSIKRIAGVLSACVRRSSDIVTRYGGEEFAIILPCTEKGNALELAEQMRKMVEELAILHSYSSVSNYLTVSLGVNTVIPSGESSVQEFIKAADIALYKAKENRNNIVVA